MIVMKKQALHLPGQQRMHWSSAPSTSSAGLSLQTLLIAPRPI
jgi:hypothetical protein